MTKSKVMVILRKPVKCDIRLRGVALGQVEKFKYVGVWLTDAEIAQAGAVMQQLGRFVVRRAGLSSQAKLSIFGPFMFLSSPMIMRCG